jgi:hypothetical protein
MDVASALHDHGIYGIRSVDTVLWVWLLIHDVDHHAAFQTLFSVRKNQTLPPYKNKSVAEQNSVDLAWNALMD